MTAINITPYTTNWLERRKHTICSTDAPVILGVAPQSKTVEEYIKEKREYNTAELATSLEQQQSMLPLLKHFYTKETGNEIFSTPLYQHKEHLWMTATPDGWVVGEDSEFPLFCKIIPKMDKVEWFDYNDDNSDYDTVPLKYWVQVQHQLAVTEEDSLKVFVIFAGTDLIKTISNMYIKNYTVMEAYALIKDVVDFRIIDVKRDDEFISKLIEQEKEFWDKLQQSDVVEKEPTQTKLAVLAKEMELSVNELKRTPLSTIIEHIEQRSGKELEVRDVGILW